MALSLKNKLVAASCSLVFFALFLQCTSENENGKAETKTSETINSDNSDCDKPVNPNGDSELALLMRQMLHSSQSVKEMVEQGKLPDKFPEEFMKIHTAKPTDSETKKNSFDNFASAYLINLRELYESPKEELKSNYNAVVNVCIGCHSEHCPGPLKTISKLKIM